MARFGFTTSGSYTSQSPNAADDKCVNFYPEVNEAPNGKSPMSLYPTPGLTLLTTIYANRPLNIEQPSIRGVITFEGRTFLVAGNGFYEINGTPGEYALWGSVPNLANEIVSFAAGPNQVLMTCSGSMYVFTLSTNTLSAVDPTTYIVPITQVAYSDGFFIALTGGSGEFQVSSPDDATTWSLLDESIISVFPDNIVGMIVAYRQPIFFGVKQSVAYYDAGTAITPFAVVPGGFMEQGAAATNAISFMDNSVFWIGADARGQGVAWRANGYTPVRVSTHAVEFAWQGYSKISDAVSYTYQDQGHTFWVIYFPTPSKTWVYDAATNLWHERNYFNNGQPVAHLSQCYTFNFGMHLVGDWRSGNIYSMSINTWQDNGTPIQRIRRAPHIAMEQQWIFHHQVQVDMETGLGPQPPLLDGSGNPREPQMNLRWSDDGGHTWSNYQPRGAGFAGNYTKRVIWRRLGRSRDRVYELETTDNFPPRIMDAYALADPGWAAQERISSQLSKVS